MVDVPQATPPPSSRRRLVRRLAGVAAAAVFLVAFGLAAVTWVIASHPYDPAQQPGAAQAGGQAGQNATTLLPAVPGAILALTYHAVDDTEPNNPYTLTRANFSAHMAFLSAAGYRTIRLNDLERAVSGQPVTLPSKPLLLTVDDGIATDWTTIDPILAQYHFTALAFIITSHLVEPGMRSYYLSTKELQQLQATGRWEFGAHTDNLHYRAPVQGGFGAALTNYLIVNGRPETDAEWHQRVASDLARNQAVLRQLLDKPATAFAFPFGDADEGHKEPTANGELPGLLQQNGLNFAFVDGNPPSGHVDALGPWSNRLGLQRVPLVTTVTPGELIHLIRLAIPVALPAKLEHLPWVGDHATCTNGPPSTPPTLIVRADGYGSCVLREVNTSQWTDYELALRLDAVSARSTAVIALRDGTGTTHQGRLEVVIGDSNVVVRESLPNGDKPVLATVPLDVDPTHKGVRDVSIRMHGDTADVQVSGAAPITTKIDPQLRNGGVFFATAGTGPHATIIESPSLHALTGGPTG